MIPAAPAGPAGLAARMAVWAQLRPDADAYTELRYRGDECLPVTVSYAQLHLAAATLAQRLRAACAPGDRVAILCAHGLDYVVAFLACLYSNRVAVPLFPANANRNRSRLDTVLTDARPALSLLSTGDEITAELFASALGRVLTVEPNAAPAEPVPHPVVDSPRDELAYLQYTSGASRAPTGVAVTQANLAAALSQLWHAVPAARDRPIANWLPFFHDMGLIIALSLPLYSGVHGITLAPERFVERPIRWLRACSDFRAGTTAGPNFGLALAVSTAQHERIGLDLSGLDVLLNGAEPIRAEVLTEFTSAFHTYGFRHRAHTPGFGLAEATLPVTICAPDEDPVVHHFDRIALAKGRAVALAPEMAAVQSVTLVGCGRPAGQRVAVVDPGERAEVAEGIVGEIWVSGPTVCAGYFGNRTATAETFYATISGRRGSWLRTGDLGFWYAGQLYIADRLKDLVIIDGRKHYPADIETTVAACAPTLRPGHIAAFGYDSGQREELVVVAELGVIEGDQTALAELARHIRNVVAATHEVVPGAVVLVEAGRIPKTSSGKLRRTECRALYGAGRLPRLAGVGTHPHPLGELGHLPASW